MTKIILDKKSLLERQKRDVSLEELKKKVEVFTRKASFKDAITKEAGRISLIAEIKQASPSKGIIREDFNPVEIATAYQEAGASALSVLTEEKYFKGSLSSLKLIKEVCGLPILRKDFIIDAYQIYESCVMKADAILLIAEILSATQLSEFLDLARNLGLDCLVEASSAEELNKVLKSDARIVGINNRNLRTFKVDLNTSRTLVPLVPKERIIVVESGIKESEDITFLKSLGVNAVLIGEALLRAKNIKDKIRDLMA